MRGSWGVVFFALGIVAACDLNPQPEVPAEQGAAGQNGLGGTGGLLNSGGSAGVTTGIGGAFDNDAAPAAMDDASDANPDEGPDASDADADAGDADLDASDAD